MDAAFDNRETGLGPDPASVGSVVVLRPGGLGTMVKAVPALRHLRGVYPDSRVSIVAHKGALELISGCPYVDDCIDADADLDAVLGAPIDVLVSFAGPNESSGAADGANSRVHEIPAGTRVAYRCKAEPATLTVHPEWPERLADAFRMLRLVWLLGGIEPDRSLSLWPRLADRNGAAGLMAGVDGPIALVHPGASDTSRRWPVEQFARVIDVLSTLGLTPVVVGTAEDNETVEQLHERATTRFVDLVGATTVGVLAGLMERASVFVGNDSGPSVLATTLGVQSVVIGPASPIEQTGNADRVAYVTTDHCSVCDESACEAHGLASATDVPIEAVLAHVVLAAEHGRRRWETQRI